MDATGGLPDGSTFSGVDGLERGLLENPETFARTLSERLLTFALGREVEPSDAPAIRSVLRDAQPRNYRFSDLIVGLVKSAPFTMRETAR